MEPRLNVPFQSGFQCRSIKLAVSLGLACLLFTPPLAFAQGEQEQELEQEQEATASGQGDVEEVIVTGSRLRRTTYTSVTPLQIISAEVKREAGLIDAGKIIQESTASAGQQIDLTFAGYVLPDGPGTVTADLRGLGASRTLVLINGRRVAPSGVEGAPASPDLGIIPGILVQQYDQLLDGASSVYGSDAVAGVNNAILRKDFNGFDLDFVPTISKHGGGDDTTVAARWGMNFDRGFVGVGAQYTDNDPVTLADRPWTAGCDRHVEIDQAGRIRHQDLYYSNVFGMEWGDCRWSSAGGRVFVPDGAIGYVYYTPGYSNGGWPNFSESSSYGFGIDGDGDGRTDLTFADYTLNGRQQYSHLEGARTTFSAMAYGEYTLEGDANLAPYFELLYARREFFINSGEGVFFPDVPADNPFNLCNPNGAGVDCGLAKDALFTNPNFVRSFANRFAGFCAARGVPPAACTPATFGLLTGAIGPLGTIPVVSVRGDRNLLDSETDIWRAVAGITGDMNFLNVGSLSNWTFDLSVTHSSSSSTAVRPGIRADRAELALGAYSTTHTPCENDTGAELAADTAAGCVPVDMSAPSLYSPIVGDFATPAERNYLFDNRDFGTDYEQTVFTYYMSGDVFELPDGPVSVGLGAEYRLDDIRSIPDHVARDGLLFGFFSDGGAVGDKYTRELFGEAELPIVGGKVAARELTLNVSARLTDDEYYGSAWTGASKLGYRPIDSLLIRATYGTSYRAPNLRELFLQAQTGFLNVFDPCLIPDDAIDPISGGYLADLDRREPYVLENCRAHGVDPTLANNNGFNVYSVEVSQGGSLALDEETSQSKSFGFAWDQPFTNAFDLTIGLSYYDIEIKNTIIDPTPSYIVGDCYLRDTGPGTFCNRIIRDADPEAPLFSLIDRAFVNRDSETARGVDLNIAFDATLVLGDREVELSFEAEGHRQIERTELFINDDGDVDFNEYQREFYYPERKASMTFRIDYRRWGGTWFARYIGRMEHDAATVDEWSDINGSTSTCLGPPDDLLCHDVGRADDYWVHTGSIRYTRDTWGLQGGITNIFDRAPPMVDGSERVAANNAPLGAGYDLDGRVYFLSASVQFGGE